MSDPRVSSDVDSHVLTFFHAKLAVHLPTTTVEFFCGSGPRCTLRGCEPTGTTGRCSTCDAEGAAGYRVPTTQTRWLRCTHSHETVGAAEDCAKRLVSKIEDGHPTSSLPVAAR